VIDLIAEISSARVERPQRFSQVSEAVAQLGPMTQQNAVLVEESAAAAECLKQQAASLAEVVAMFKLGDGDSHQATFIRPHWDRPALAALSVEDPTALPT
jgi:hypothetical protein